MGYRWRAVHGESRQSAARRGRIGARVALRRTAAANRGRQRGRSSFGPEFDDPLAAGDLLLQLLLLLLIF